MRDHVISWVPDNTVSGVHNSKPLTCAEYISALEDRLETADSTALKELRRSFGLDKAEPGKACHTLPGSVTRLR